MEGADFFGAHLEGANLEEAHLEGAGLTKATLTGAHFDSMTISPTTDLTGVIFGKDHDAQVDGASTVAFAPRRDRLLNWARLRETGSLPLFGVSYFALVVSLFIINGLGVLNEIRPFEAQLGQVGVVYPIPMPERAIEILIASLLLSAGATLFKFGCPRMVQRFTEEEWLYQLGHCAFRRSGPPSPLHVDHPFRGMWTG